VCRSLTSKGPITNDKQVPNQDEENMIAVEKPRCSSENQSADRCAGAETGRHPAIPLKNWAA